MTRKLKRMRRKKGVERNDKAEDEEGGKMKLDDTYLISEWLGEDAGDTKLEKTKLIWEWLGQEELLLSNLRR